MIPERRECRFCGSRAKTGELVKYGVRHYAHFRCYLDEGRSLEAISPWQLRSFPVALLVERGIDRQAFAILEAAGDGPS